MTVIGQGTPFIVAPSTPTIRAITGEIIKDRPVNPAIPDAKLYLAINVFYFLDPFPLHEACFNLTPLAFLAAMDNFSVKELGGWGPALAASLKAGIKHKHRRVGAMAAL
jgi:hypothetical protein